MDWKRSWRAGLVTFKLAIIGLILVRIVQHVEGPIPAGDIFLFILVAVLGSSVLVQRDPRC